MIDVALSPCPNDTFLFAAWIHGWIDTPLRMRPHFADIEELNRLALAQRFPLVKISLALLPQLRPHYRLLPVGAALGWGVGPKVVALQGCQEESVVAFPGEHTTAYALYTRFFPPPQRALFCRYDEVLSSLRRGEAHRGLLIHEERGSFPREEFVEHADLGLLWESHYALPLPLGGLVLEKGCAQEVIIATLQASYDFAKAYPERVLPYVLQWSQDKRRETVEEHIALYVTEETRELSAQGKKAIEVLAYESPWALVGFFNHRAHREHREK